MKIKCPACSRVLNIPETAAGKVVKCPCGKQLRAPAGKGAAPVAATGAARAPAASAAASSGGADAFDPAMFDELTDADLMPVRGVGSKPAPPAKPSGNTAKMLQQEAGSSGGGDFKRGPLASRANRLAAAFLDGIFISLMAAPVIGIIFAVMNPFEGLATANPSSEAEAQALVDQVFGKFLVVYVAALVAGYALPIILYAVMVTKSGQTPAKKLCRIRIVTEDTKELPGFVKGVLLRSWLTQLLYMIPFFALADLLWIFGDNRQCIHDKIAGTIVVDT